jgi:1,4-dihydroxy-2-naphthoyl-CoA hydrolase
MAGFLPGHSFILYGGPSPFRATDMSKLHPGVTPETLTKAGHGFLPGYLGVAVLHIEQGRLRTRMALSPHHIAPNGYLHAGAIVTLADTSCGYATMSHLPDGAQSFTTIELKSNHLSTLRDGALLCEATVQHMGRNTHVWDAIVTDEATGRKIALFRCSQMILWPKSQ